MAYETLLFDVADGLARITINRPDKLNALNGTVIARAGRRGRGGGRRSGGRTRVILTGAGPKAFVAGADIGELTQPGTDGRQGAGTRRADGVPRLRATATSR